MLQQVLIMSDESTQSANSNAKWHGWQAYTMGAVCLLIGLLIGYIAKGSAPVAVANPVAQPQSVPAAAARPQAMPSLEDMKRMADQQAAPLLGRLQSDPKNAELLNQVGTVYRVTHQFQTAASYYEKSLALNPKNVGARTDLASCMFYQGNVDGAIAQLEQSLTYDPKHAGTLLNLGMVRWRGKNDAAGAIASWQKLLKYHPDYENRDMVKRLIGEAQSHAGNKLVSQPQ